MKNLLLALFIITGSLMRGQKLENQKGDLSILKQVSEMNIVFKYDKLKMMKENISEAEYIEKHKVELNNKNGSGESWHTEWKNAKKMIWEAKFLELMNKNSKNKIHYVTSNNTSKYTLIVDVIWLYPGWDAFMVKQHAKVTTNLKIVDSTNNEIVIFEVDSIEAPGDQFGNNFNDESRIGEGFAKTGKTLSKLIVKNLK